MIWHILLIFAIELQEISLIFAPKFNEKEMKYAFFWSIILCLMVCGCNSQGQPHTEAEEEHHEDGVIEFSIEKQKAIGLQTETLSPSAFRDAFRVSGQVRESQGDEMAVVAKSSGVLRFTRDHMSDGSPVKQGETLGYITADGIAGGDEVAQNAVELERTRQAFERAERLVKEGIVSRKEFEEAEAAYKQARLRSRGDGQKGGSSVTSPITGFIRSIVVKQGEYVELGSVVAYVTKSCDLQLSAEVPEKYFSRMKDITGANFCMSYAPDVVYNTEALNGHIVGIGRRAAEGSAYIPVTFEFENKGDIVPGSFADIWLLGTERENVISVPVSALTEEQGFYYIYVQGEHDDDFEKREVVLGARNGERTEILSGVKAGEKVVTQGAYQLKLASASNAIPETHQH